MEVLLNRYSYCACMNKSYLFAAMFEDSKIAQDIILGKTKCSYASCHGLTPYFRESFVEQILKASFIVTMFDESFNSAVRIDQMDLQVRFRSKEKG